MDPSSLSWIQNHHIRLTIYIPTRLVKSFSLVFGLADTFLIVTPCLLELNFSMLVPYDFLSLTELTVFSAEEAIDATLGFLTLPPPPALCEYHLMNTLDRSHKYFSY